MDDKKRKIIFHIVNSIKGGSGKSTISFFLADYFNKKQDCKAVIIDLDVNGSSWFNDHKIENFGKNFIQNYFYKPQEIVSHENASIVYKFQDKDDKTANIDGRIEAYLCDPNNSFLMSKCELDLFENLIFVIINHIINKFKSDKAVHIILDMPPSYEEHADRIINHLLIDNNSPLYKDFKDEFRIIHHLICASTYSHIQLNKNYLHSVVEEKERSYSNAIKALLNSKNYHFIFSINDLHGKIKQADSKNEKDDILAAKERVFNQNKNLSINKDNLSVAFIKKYNYSYPTWTTLLENKAPSNPLCKDDNCFNVVENMYDALSDFFETVDGLLK